MLGNRQQLYVGEPKLFDMIDQLDCEFPVREDAISLLRVPSPGTEVHFVRSKRLTSHIAAGALFHPIRVFPLIQ